MDLTLGAKTSLEGVNPAEWNALGHSPSPFLEWGFLRALELSGSTGEQAGWSPTYLTLHADLGQGSQLVGAVAAFVKTHSYGEYIFDFQWANAAQGAGLRYYPKLVIAAPVTPATGPRILLHPSLDSAQRREASVRLVEAVLELAQERKCESIHWLFCTEEEQALLAELGFSGRSSLQFHWQNRDYTEFGEFLGTMQSRKRKKFKKERSRVQAQIDRLEWVEGEQLGPEHVRNMQDFYEHTTSTHHGRPYLEPSFFEHLFELQRDRARMVQAWQDDEVVAGALFFETEGGLYGRYWGERTHVDCLHFEVSYWAGIERCIAKKIPLFEAGAQGEHKLLRGFEPRVCRSAHRMRHPGLHEGISRFCNEESRATGARLAALAEYGPYRSQD